MRARGPVRVEAVAAAGFGGWLALFLAAQVLLLDDPAARARIAGWMTIPLDLGVVILWAAAAWVTRRDRRTAAAWGALTVGMVLMLAGDSLWSVGLGASVRAPFPSLADVAYLGCLLVVPPAMLSFRSRATTRGDVLRFALDTTVVMVVGLMAAWRFVLADASAGTTDPADAILATTYLLGDLLLLFGLAVVALRRPRATDRRAMRLLTLGVFLFLLADVAFAHDVSDAEPATAALSDGLFAVATACFGLAGLAAIRDRDRIWPTVDETRDDLVATLPYVALLLGWLLLVGVAWTGGETLVLVSLAGLLTLLVVGRQLLVVRENQRLTAERARRAGEEHFRALVQHATDLITVADPTGRVRFQTPSLGTLLGYPPETCVGTPLVDLVHPDDQGRYEELLATARAGSAATPREIRLRHRDGYWVPTDTSVDDLCDEPAVNGVVLTSRDIRERKALEERLVHQALHDPLTGLPNRTLFRERVQYALYRAIREDSMGLWVLFLDIDDFKTINDRLGHEVGDLLLQAFGERLTQGVRPEDTPARLGGDEFAIAMAGMPDVAKVVGRAQRLIDALARPYLVAGAELHVTASVGIAEARRGELDAQRVLRDADAAMYRAKAAGRNRYALAPAIGSEPALVGARAAGADHGPDDIDGL